MFIPLPKAVIEVVTAKTNFSLLFNKWVHWDGSFDNPAELGENKVRELIRLKDEYEKQHSRLQFSCETQKIRISSLLYYLQQKGHSIAFVTCKVSDALVCGIGDEHPLENSLRFDHCTGLPYIPSSSIKGVARFAADPGDMADILFGTQDHIGKVQFWDGFPTALPKLKIDIMNNHFQDYYSGKSSAPSDDMSPNPVPFIVVDSESEFYFPVVATNQTLLKSAVQALKQALEEWGVGAKTAVGYGMFYGFEEKAIVPPPPKPKILSPKDVALENFKKAVNNTNFDRLLSELRDGDEKWLTAAGFFSIPNINIGLVNSIFENTEIPAEVIKMLAHGFRNMIDLKAARKRAEKKKDRKDLDRWEKLTAIIEL